MKIFCFILSIYVFFLSTGFCCLDDTCNDEIEIEADNHSQEHQEEDCLTCSPFLNCGTCSGFVFTSLQVDINEILLIKDKSEAIYKSHFLTKFFNEIWQPPKIS